MAVYMFMTSSVLMHSHGLAEALIFSRNYLDLVITKHGKITIPEITPGVVRWIPDCIARKNGIDLIIFWDSVPYGSLRWCQGTMTWLNVVLWLVNTEWFWPLIGQVWCRAWRCGCGSPSQTGARNRKTYKTSGKDRIIMAFKRNFDKDQIKLNKRIWTMSWKMRGGSCVMSSTNGRWDEAGPGMLRTNQMPGCGHVTRLSQSWPGDAARDAGVGRARWCQPIREQQLTSDAGPWHWHMWGLEERCEAWWLGQWYSRRCYDKPYLVSFFLNLFYE